MGKYRFYKLIEVSIFLIQGFPQRYSL
ncbi:hypothetical protein IIV6-T1_013 [Invertebrate iridescent virus 6]|nr:hypothetical protein IIV6-T1_013 [Invertebrate iridescent virus 6]